MNRIALGLILAALFAAPGFPQSNEDCMECHGSEKLKKVVDAGTERSYFVDIDELHGSIHGDLDCVDCHMDYGSYPHAGEPAAVDCGFCHDEAQSEYAESVHGLANGKGDVRTATCSNCHGTHGILPSSDPLSSTYKTRIEATCAVCHSSPDVLLRLGIRGDGPVKAYHESVHARVMREHPEENPPSCIDCHEHHAIFSITDPRSSFSPLRIPETCGRCHEEARDHYVESIHWSAVKRGRYESPVCNDCHGEHGIDSPGDRYAATNRLRQSSRLCAKCHSNGPLMERFGLDAERMTSYMKSYHGLALLKGSPRAATCTSCHEVHDIRSAADPDSTVNPAHLKETCSRCHEKVTEDFARISVHPIDMQTRNPYAYWIARVYIYLIIFTIGGMLLHNAVILFFHMRRKYRMEMNCKPYQRFRKFEVFQHLLLLLSFFTLVITGFALKFPHAFWVEWLLHIGLTETVRSMVHRTAGVVMIAASLAQAVYFVATRSGRRDVRALVPTLKDITDFWQNMRYHLRLSGKQPKFGRFDYTEKVEYLALIWGTVVMAVTGLVLWFPELIMAHAPSWVFEASETIHFYEALLATLAIIIWHWFFVIYHPENYPLNMTVLHGKICDLRFRHHHPLEYAEVRGDLRRADPPRRGLDAPLPGERGLEAPREPAERDRTPDSAPPKE